MKKRIQFVLLALVLLLGVALPVTASAGTNTYGVNRKSEHYQLPKNPFATEVLRGQCTWYVYGRVSEKLSITMPLRSHAKKWWSDNLVLQEKGKGYASSETTPKENSIIVFDKDSFSANGHVAFIEKIENDTIYFTEANFNKTVFLESSMTMKEAENKKRSIGKNMTVPILGYVYVGEGAAPKPPTAATKIVAIEAVTATPKSVAAGKSVKLQVKTSKSATKIEVINEQGELVAGSSKHDASTTSGYIWDIAWKTEKVGERTLKVRAFGSDGKYAEKSINVTVTGVITGGASITSVTATPKSVAAGKSVKLQVKTNKSVTKIEVINEQGELVAGSSKYDSSTTSGYTWDIAWKTEKVGERAVRVRALGADGKYAEKSINVTVTKAKAAAAPKVAQNSAIQSFTVSNKTPLAGEIVTSEIVTDNTVARVDMDSTFVESAAGHTEKTTKKSTAGATATWSHNFKAIVPGLKTATSGTIILKATAYDANDKKLDEKKITITVSKAGTQKSGQVSAIKSVTVTPKTVAVGEYVRYEIVSDSTITEMRRDCLLNGRAWNDGYSTVYQTDATNNTRIWRGTLQMGDMSGEVTFRAYVITPEGKGKRQEEKTTTYTITAK